MKQGLRRFLIAITIILLCLYSANAQTPARHTNGTVYGGYATAPITPTPQDGQIYYNNVDKKYYKYDGTNWTEFGAYKTNIAALGPTVTDDSSSGYTILSRWIDNVTDKEYVCLDASIGAAVWKETTNGAGGGSLEVKDEGISTVATATILNFVGSAVTVTDAGAGEATVTIVGGSGESTTVSDTPEIDMTLTGADITSDIVVGSIDVLKLDAGVQSSLGLADSSLQSEVDGSTTNELQNLSWVDGTNTIEISSGTNAIITGFLETEVDGSITNEIQTIDISQLTGTDLELSLSSDGEATKIIDLSPLQDHSIETVVQSAQVNEVAGITVGQILYISGATGGFPEVSLADNTDYSKSDVLAIALETKSDNQQIQVGLLGLMENINTNLFTEGQILYLGTSGSIVTAHPTGLDAVIRIGKAVKINAVSGSILFNVDNLTTVDNVNGFVRNQLVNTSAGTSAIVNTTYVNDANHYLSINMGGSNNSFGASQASLYSTGHGDFQFVNDGNKDFSWFTDVGDTHNLSYTEKMRLTSAGFLTAVNLSGTNTGDNSVNTLYSGLVSNVSTNLSLGTITATTVDVNSSDGTNVTLLEANTTQAGILGSDKWDEIVANSLKISNITQTSIVGITGTKAQFDTAVTDGNFLYVGDVTSFPGFSTLLSDYGYTEPTHSLADLTDVDATVGSPTDGKIMVYRSAGTDWILEDKPVPGGGGATQLDELSDVVSATNTNKFALMANGTTGYIGRALVEADISDFGTYLTSYTEAQTWQDVTALGNTTDQNLTINGTTVLIDDLGSTGEVRLTHDGQAVFKNGNNTEFDFRPSLNRMYYTYQGGNTQTFVYPALAGNSTVTWQDAGGTVAYLSDISGSGATQLNELSDVNTSTITNRNVLVADGVDFESRALVEADISDLGTYLTTEVDGSISNELQTLANTSDATSHTVTLSNSGGSHKIIEGSGITFVTTGTALDGITTITSSAGGGNVTKVGTPVNTQMAYWTGDGTLAGASEILYTDGVQVLYNGIGIESDYFKVGGGTGLNVLIDNGTTKLISDFVQTEVDPIYIADPAFSIVAGDITNLGNLSGTNTGDDTNDYLRADVADTKTAGNLIFNDDIHLRFGTGSDMGLFHDSSTTKNYLTLTNGNFIIKDGVGVVDRFTFGRTTGDFTATGDITAKGALINNIFNPILQLKHTNTSPFVTGIDALYSDDSPLFRMRYEPSVLTGALRFTIGTTSVMDIGSAEVYVNKPTSVNGNFTATGNIISQGAGDNSFVGNIFIGDGTASPEIRIDKGGAGTGEINFYSDGVISNNFVRISAGEDLEIGTGFSTGHLYSGGVDRFNWSADYFQSKNSFGGALRAAETSITSPFTHRTNDINTGIGGDGSDNLSMVSNGKVGIISSDAGTGTNIEVGGSTGLFGATIAGQGVLRLNDVITTPTGTMTSGGLLYVTGTELHYLGDGGVDTNLLAGGGATNLSEGTTTNTTVDINSDTGTNATLQEASTTRAGVMSKAKFDEVVVNNGKVTNASTNLSLGTATATTMDVNSSDGTNATLTLANGTTAGVSENNITDAEKTVLGNTSGTNSGDNATNTLYDGLVEQSKSITIESPTATEDISMFFTNKAITITEIRAVVRGSTPSVTWTIRHGTDRSATGSQVVTGGTTTTSETTGSDVTTFIDASIVLDSFVWFETTAQTGTVDEINLTIIYTVD